MPVDAPLPCKKRQKKHDRRFRKNYKDDLRVEYSVIPEATGPAAGDKVGPPNPESVQVKDVQAVEGIPAKNEIRDELIRELVRHVGLHHTKIEEALDATAQDGITYEDWSDAAQIYLATNAAEAEKEELHAAETEQLARGMRISLEEAESKKANELPLHEQNPEELSTKFQDSPVHSMLQSESQWETLLGCQDVRKLVVDYLKMEQSCKRWFPGVEAYFEKVADDLRPLITENDSSPEKVKQFLEKNTELLEAEVFRYPMESHQLPTIFAPYIKEQEVDLTSD